MAQWLPWLVAAFVLWLPVAAGRKFGAARVVAVSRRIPMSVPTGGALGGFLAGAVLFFLVLECWRAGPGLYAVFSLGGGWWLVATALPVIMLGLIMQEVLAGHRRGGQADMLVVPVCIAAFVGLWVALQRCVPPPECLVPAGWDAVLALALLTGLLVYALLPALDIARRRNPQRAMLLCAQGDVLRNLPPLGAEPPPAAGRRIVIFCDGTSNSPDQAVDGRPCPTNVWRLFNALEKNEAQTGRYDSGVGAGFSTEARRASVIGRLVAALPVPGASIIGGFLLRIRMAFEAATGAGITENITRAYAEIVRQYSPGDRVYLIGFSRGAYTARCVAGVIRRCGLLKSENAWLAEEMVQLYRGRRPVAGGVATDPALLHADVPVEFLGLFDTVGSLGAPLWGWWFNLGLVFTNAQMNGTPAPICRHIYHAMAADERRSQFFPTPFDWPRPAQRGWTRHMEQLWFAGAHADVGGGYPETGLSDITLGWMLDAAARHGLRFDPALRAALRPDPHARRHDELERRPFWRSMGSWPRFMPVSAGNGPWQDQLHWSLRERARMFTEELARPYLVTPGPMPLRTEALARMEWCATGLVLKKGALYRLRHVGGSWRDASCPPCGAEGQRMVGADLARSLLAPARRLPRENYMLLCAALATPQRWPLHEGGIGELLDYTFRRTPPELAGQVAPIGRDMAGGGSVILRNELEDGLLYLFANDLWLTARNNTGALTLEIREITPGDCEVAPRWSLRPQPGSRFRWPDGTRFPRWIRE